jgi:hypothetical protein
MLGIGIVLVWAGYGVASYGWCLLRGYDVPFRAWMSPLNPYQWPAGGPATIPDNQLFPTGQGGQSAAAAPAQPGTQQQAANSANQAAQNAGRPFIPGSVAGRL